MKRVHAAAMMLLAGAMLAAPITGCAKPREARKPGSLRILCSSYPMYLFTRAVAGSQPDVLVEPMLAANAGCEHDYSLSPQDLAKITKADVFVITGLGMERNQGYLDRIPKGAGKGPRVLDSSDGIPADDLIDLSGEAGRSGPKLRNPHLFADPRMAAKVVRNIARQLGEIDPARAVQAPRPNRAERRLRRGLQDDGCRPHARERPHVFKDGIVGTGLYWFPGRRRPV